MLCFGHDPVGCPAPIGRQGAGALTKAGDVDAERNGHSFAGSPRGAGCDGFEPLRRSSAWAGIDEPLPSCLFLRPEAQRRPLQQVRRLETGIGSVPQGAGGGESATCAVVFRNVLASEKRFWRSVARISLVRVC